MVESTLNRSRLILDTKIKESKYFACIFSSTFLAYKLSPLRNAGEWTLACYVFIGIFATSFRYLNLVSKSRFSAVMVPTQVHVCDKIYLKYLQPIYYEFYTRDKIARPSVCLKILMSYKLDFYRQIKENWHSNSTFFVFFIWKIVRIK